MGVSDDGKPILNDSVMRETLRLSSEINLPVIQHAEDTRMTGGCSMNAGRVAFRSVTSDRMPMIGNFADETASARDAQRLRGAWPLDLPRVDGLYGAFAYGSRGLVWAALGAELIASQIEGEPWPLERDLAEDIDPARFLLRALRQGTVS